MNPFQARGISTGDTKMTRGPFGPRARCDYLSVQRITDYHEIGLPQPPRPRPATSCHAPHDKIVLLDGTCKVQAGGVSTWFSRNAQKRELALLFPPRRHLDRVKLALHRSLIFWSGIVVMAFIVWAWRDSFFRLHSFRAGAWTVFHSQAALVVSFNPEHHHTPSANREELLVIHVVGEPFPLPFIGRGKRQSDGDLPASKEGPRTLRDNWQYYLIFQPPAEWVLFLPHWIMLLACAVPWSGLLVCRARRRRSTSFSSRDR
jgi:hypothetical protein